MGYTPRVKTTVEIADALLERARRHARRSGRSVRALIEEGLQHAIDVESADNLYTLPDRSVGDPGGADPLESMSWQDLRTKIYEDR